MCNHKIATIIAPKKKGGEAVLSMILTIYWVDLPSIRKKNSGLDAYGLDRANCSFTNKPPILRLNPHKCGHEKDTTD